jgi:hypothetical protein
MLESKTLAMTDETAWWPECETAVNPVLLDCGTDDSINVGVFVP